MGGSRSIPEHVTQTLEEHGGAVFVAAEVERILVENGRAVGVRMSDGRELRAPIVVSDAGAPNTYLRLLPREIAEPTGLPARLREIGPSSGHLSLYLGLDRTDRELGLDGTNLWIYPEPDREKAFAQFVHDPSAPIPLVLCVVPLGQGSDVRRASSGQGHRRARDARAARRGSIDGRTRGGRSAVRTTTRGRRR